MSVRRPYRNAPEFEFIRIMVNPEGIPSKSRLKVLRDMQFQGRVHPWRSKFQFLLHLEDQVAKSRDVLLIAHEDLEAWKCAEIHGVELAAIPYAEWHVRVERLKRDASYLITSLDRLSDRQSEVHVMLKEQVDLNSGTRSLILAILASVYIPLAFVSSYFGMNTHEITQGGILSVATYWKVSVPLVVASIFIPIAFSGLLIRTALNIVIKALNIVSAAWDFLCNLYIILRFLRTLSKGGLWSGFTLPTHHEDSGQAMEGDVTGSVAMA
ncbi:MAG: hypothetical protein Q9196_002434 [Gyalolechia fulgens]